LAPFSNAAKGIAESLNAHPPTGTELKKTSGEAANAALGLSVLSGKMATYAEQMKDSDAAGKAVDDYKQVVDNAEAEIKKFCAANAGQCVELAKALTVFPPPPDKSEDDAATDTWIGKLGAWAAELTKVDIQDPGLKLQLQTFNRGWRDFGGAMSKLVTIVKAAKTYDELSHDFNAQIDQANKSIAEANAFCR
jgi:hypothetical protein